MRAATKKRLKELGYKSHSAYCRSLVWKRRRAGYFLRHRKECWICGVKTQIHLHHVCYDRIGGGELDADLLALCKKHHRGLHSYMKRHRQKLETAHLKYKEVAR